jgi:hypothetical protein
MNKEEYDDGNNNDNKSAEGNYDNNSIDNESESAANTTGKDIKKGMDKYEAKMKSGEDPPAGDSTRSEE